MKKKVIVFMISIVLVFTLVACGSTKTEDIEVTTGNAKTEEESDITENEADYTEDIENKEVQVQEVKLNLSEYQYTFEDRNIEKNGKHLLNDNDFIEFYETVTLTGSVNLYIDADICVGYTKHDVSASLMAKNDNWYLVSIGDSIKYAKADEVDAVTLKETEEVEKVLNDEVIENIPTQEIVSTIIPDENASVENVPVETPELIQESTKYTPDKAVSVYRSAMKAGGLAWDPSLKNGGSWGTGWIYLDKGYPEWCASTSLESCSIGSNGKPWTKYYLEVTGSDDSAVYITEWHN